MMRIMHTRTKSSLTSDEKAFAERLLFETLRFDEPIEKCAEPAMRALGLQNGAIENWLRVLHMTDGAGLGEAIFGTEPPVIQHCPWESQEDFLGRDKELRHWLTEQGQQASNADRFLLLARAYE